MLDKHSVLLPWTSEKLNSNYCYTRTNLKRKRIVAISDLGNNRFCIETWCGLAQRDYAAIGAVQKRKYSSCEEAMRIADEVLKHFGFKLIADKYMAMM